MQNEALSCVLLACFLAFNSPAHARCPELVSTTGDGLFQAIAQGPRSINVYWKTNTPGAVLYVNGGPCADVPVSADPVTGFTTGALDSLEPNTLYTFSLGKEAPTVSEKTWREIPARERYDLLVVGASASGVAAAVTAARLGMRVALVEETNRVGGMASNGLGSTDMTHMTRSNGFFEDFRRQVIDHYGGGDGRRYEPRVANAIVKGMLYEHSNISLFLKCEVVAPVMAGRRACGAWVLDTTSGRTGCVLAGVTIDATPTGDYAAACGCDYRIGREARSADEPHAGVIYFDDPKQEILPGSTGAADCKQQSYAYLMTWKDYGEAGAPLISKPPFYDPKTYARSPAWTETWNYTSGRLPGGKYEINQHPFGIDWPGINNRYPISDAPRIKAVDLLYRYRALGYLYYFQNELGHKNLGLADDEYLDSESFPQALYVREARRIMGECLFKESDCTNSPQFRRVDSIAIGDYPMDSHAMEDLKDPTRIDKGEGECWLKKFTPVYQVPLGVLVPKHIDGLLVSTAVSGTHIGYGTLRMEPVRMSMGQAAAAAAYWSNLYSISPRQVRPAWVQDKILSQFSYINWNSDVDRDTRHFKAINFLTARGVFVNEAFEPALPLTREDALIVLNRLLLQESYPRGMEKSPVPFPRDACTRGQFAQWLMEAKQKVSEDWNAIDPAMPSYEDVPKGSPYYLAVETLKAHRISGLLFENAEIGKFKPDAPISHADAAEAMYLAHRAYAMNCWMP